MSYDAVASISQVTSLLMFITMFIAVVAYALWRFVEAWTDPEHKGTAATGLIIRASYVGIGVGYLGFAKITVRAGKPAAGIDVVICVQIVYLAGTILIIFVDCQHWHRNDLHARSLYAERTNGAVLRKFAWRKHNLGSSPSSARVPCAHSRIKPRLRCHYRTAHQSL